MGRMKKTPRRVRPGAFSGKKPLLLRIVVSQALVGAILVALLSTYLFQQFSRNSIREITRASEESLRQSVRVFETLWDGTYRYMNKEFLTNGMMMDAQNLESFDPVFSGEVFRYLGNIVYNSGLFHSVYLYNGKADMIFSSLGPVRTTEDFYDPGLMELLTSHKPAMPDGLNHAIVYRRMKLSGGISPVDMPVMSVIYSDNELQSAMVFNLDLQVLQNLVSGQSANTASRLLVLNGDGTVLADSLGKDVLGSFSGTDAFRTLSGGAPNGSLVREIDGERVLLAWQSWKRQAGMDWKFVSLSDYRMLLADVGILQRKVLEVSGLFILFSILISLLFGRRIYRPISSLMERIRAGQAGAGLVLHGASEGGGGSGRPDGSLNEIEYLSRTYDSLTSNVSRLLSFESAGRGAIRRNLLFRILQGEAVAKSEMARVLGDKPWLYASEGFRAVAIRLDGGSAVVPGQSADDLALLRFAVLNISEELFGGVMGVETLEVSEDLLCLLLHVGDPQETPKGQTDRIRNVLAEILAACRTHLSLSFTAGIGEEVSLAPDMRRSWKQAVEALEYRFTEGFGAVVCFEDMKLRRDLVYRYPAETERDVLEALRATDPKRLWLALERFASDLSVFAVPEVRLACTQLNMVAGRLLESVAASEEGMEPIALPAVESVETLSELLLQWQACFNRAMEAMRHKRESRHDEQLARVRERVEREYADVNLTVELLAGEADLSANYLRTLYKDAFGFSMTEHIAALRFQKAKRLLRETDLPASRIAGQVGYQSAGYFFTAFRKFTGMTPEEYRRSGD